MRIAICEDIIDDLNDIYDFLQDYFNKNSYNVEVETFNSGEELLKGFVPAKFQIIFLDIYMSGIDGIETAKKLREIDSEFALVFITLSTEHGLEAFLQRACAYVTKPITDEGMKLALKQCEKLFIKGAQAIEIMADRNPVKIPFSKILYVEIYYKEALFHTKTGVIKTQMTLTDIEKQLGHTFLRCHRSYLVNMNHIDCIQEKDIILTNEAIIPMRQRGKTQIRKCYGDFLSGNLFEE